MSEYSPELLNQVQHALADRDARLGGYARLVGQITHAVTASEFSSGGSVVEIRRLLDEFYSGSSASRSPSGAAPMLGSAVPARPAALSSPGSGGPGDPPHGRGCIGTCCLPDTWAMGTADYASAKRVMWQ